MTRLARAVATAALCALLATACGSEKLAAVHLGADQPGSPDREPGLTVLRFVQAARRGDAERMWPLLSEPTRRSIGPGLLPFARGAAIDLYDSFEDFRQGRVLLSRKLDDTWAIGAVAGRFETDEGDSEPAAYAVALRREGGRWRVELGGLVIAKLRPQPAQTAGDRPELRAEAQAGDDVEQMLLWLDGVAARVPFSRTSPFTGEIDGRPEQPIAGGEHAVVVFARTPVTAGAQAWTFDVDG
ncbi:MAG TPA: hypothetical protein VGQ15_13585 [Gaiellaceae bacterium]|nr:hypothetical protein [Gaiellaceae bacterium]